MGRCIVCHSPPLRRRRVSEKKQFISHQCSTCSCPHYQIEKIKRCSFNRICKFLNNYKICNYNLYSTKGFPIQDM